MSDIVESNEDLLLRVIERNKVKIQRLEFSLLEAFEEISCLCDTINQFGDLDDDGNSLVCSGCRTREKLKPILEEIKNE